MKKLILSLLTFCSLAASAPAVLLTFEGTDTFSVQVGTVQVPFSFHFGVLAEDDEGNALDYYIIDPSSPSPLSGELPTSAYRPTPASPGAPTGNALNAKDQLVILVFSTPVDLESLSVQLDDSTLAPSNGPIQFYSDSNSLITEISTSPEVRSATSQTTGPVSGVKSVVFAPVGYLDNMNIAGVPEPGSLLMTGAAGLGLMLRRRRNSAAA